MSREPSPKRGKAKKPTRKRRAPEEARALILEACQKLLARHGPDAVGLKDVAKVAGVSHALVTHYFGSIDDLVNAAIEEYAQRQRRAAIDRILEEPELGPRGWMEHFFTWGSRPETARMLAWTFLRGHISKEDFFSRKHRGAKLVVDAISQRLASTPGAPEVAREDLEFMLLLVLAATHGYALGRVGYWTGLGKDDPGEKQDAFFFERLADVVQLFALNHSKSPQP